MYLSAFGRSETQQKWDQSWHSTPKLPSPDVERPPIGTFGVVFSSLYSLVLNENPSVWNYFLKFLISRHVYFFGNSVARICSYRQSGGFQTQLPPENVLASWRYLGKLAKIWRFFKNSGNTVLKIVNNQEMKKFKKWISIGWIFIQNQLI